MKHRMFAAGICAAMLCGILTGCGQKQIQLQELPILNYTAPQPGDTIVTIHVKDYGDIRIRLFTEQLPEACENFVTLAEQGYYDELIFHRVIKDFMIQSGDPKGDGTGGASCWGGTFNAGMNEQFINVPGAIGYGNAGSLDTASSQFYIVTGETVTEDDLKAQTEKNGIYYTTEARELYKQYGGAPWLDTRYTVFGQVIDGLDIVYAISEVPVNKDNNKPKEAVYIENVTVEQYDGSEIRWYPADYGLQ